MRSNDFKGFDKLLEINPDFSWVDVRYIENLDYSVDLNEYGEKVSILKICFLAEFPNKANIELFVKFNEVSCLKIDGFGGNYNQIIGFEIVDQSISGWEEEQRYAVRDFENGSISFYCKSIEVLSVK